MAFNILDILETSNVKSKVLNANSIISNPNIELNTSKSKKAVPVIYDKTIAEMAQIYLGDAERATELVLLNGLVPPFIDENGTIATFLSNATGTSFNIADGSALYIGQKIILSSTTVVPFSRAILDVKKLSSGHYMVTVDGASTLNTLKLANSAKMTWFKRGTVNSNNTIFIPSNLDLGEVPKRMRPLPYYFKDTDGLSRYSGVDIALGSNSDIIMDTNGRVGLVGGLANLEQALRLKFITAKGTLNRHPGYGCGIVPGTSVADTSASDIRDQAEATVSSDRRFGEIQFIQVSIAGPIVNIRGAVSVNATDSVLPFSMSIG